MNKHTVRLLSGVFALGASFFFVIPAATASDLGGTSKPTAVKSATVDHLVLGRAAKGKNDWPTAIHEFALALKANPKSADAANLLGFSYRKSGNLPKAFVAYSVALRLDPHHKGALEYQGVAFIMNHQLDKAAANLSTLGAECGNKTCEEYRDLAAEIAAAPAK